MKITKVAALSILAIFSHAYAESPKPILIAENGIIHRFFDTSPISPSGKYAALFRLPYENAKPKAGDAGEVVVVELPSMREVFSTKTRGWETQMGANVQWGNSDDAIFYNDVDTSDWSEFAVRLNFKTGQKTRLNGTVFMVSPDGKKLVSHNLRKSRFAQVGYGVVVPDAFVKRNVGISDSDGIFVTDVASNECKMIASIRDIYEKTVPSIAIDNPEKYEFYCFQAKWNPQGTRILATLQWTPLGGGKRRRAVVTMNPDGSGIRTAITPEQWAKGGHHINWMPDGQTLSMNLNVDGKKGLKIITVKYDGSGLKKVYAPGSGHPSFHPLGVPYIITDAYVNELPLPDGKSPIRLIDVKNQTEKTVAKVLNPRVSDSEFRVDAHPVWVNGGTRVVFNATKNGKRCVYMLDVSGFLNEPALNAAEQQKK